ncbi:MAG: metalloregulator ArsR/SmtB family transcription factor [Candidatus Paceibacterota bacterium]
MDNKNMGKKNLPTKNKKVQERHARPSWVPRGVMEEETLCPDCFKAVGERNRYRLIRMLGRAPEGMTVGELTKKIGLRQPTVTHHLQALLSVEAVNNESRGRERLYTLNRGAHCFDECKIPY